MPNALFRHLFSLRICFSVFPHGADVQTNAARPMFLLLQKNMIFCTGGFIHPIYRPSVIAECMRRAIFQALSAMQTKIFLQHSVRRNGSIRQNRYDAQARPELGREQVMTVPDRTHSRIVPRQHMRKGSRRTRASNSLIP